MSGDEHSTLERIHAAAKNEFLQKGFRSASLRSIVKNAGVTTGAFYGYYDSKERLFEALVEEQYQWFMDCYCGAQERFARLPPDEQHSDMGKISRQCMLDMLHYAYEHLEAFRLILYCSEGTRFASMIDDMVEIEVQSTHAYQAVLEELGYPSPPIDSRLEHFLITGMFNAYFELILHAMPIEQAEKYLSELHEFYEAGWMKIMGQ